MRKQDPVEREVTLPVPMPMPAARTVPEVLEQAARYIEHRGWATVWENEHGAVCADGAIILAATGGRTAHQAGARVDLVRQTENALLDHINTDTRGKSWRRWRNPPPGFHSVPAWNDRTGRTEDEVVATLRAAADAYRDSPR